MKNSSKKAHRIVKVCQNRTCRRDGAAQVLDVFKAHPISGVEIIGCGCLGQCGKGPMVLVEPEQIWYWRVHPQDVSLIMECHLNYTLPVQGAIGC